MSTGISNYKSPYNKQQRGNNQTPNSKRESINRQRQSQSNDEFSEMQIDYQSTPLKYDYLLNRNNTNNGFQSKKLLNFNDKVSEEQRQHFNNQVQLKDILGANTFLFSPSPLCKQITRHIGSQNGKGLKNCNVMASPQVKPFTPTQNFGYTLNDRLQESGSTASSVVISEEEYMAQSPLRQRCGGQGPRTNQFSLALRQLELNYNEDFLMMQNNNHQNFKYQSPMPKQNINFSTPDQINSMQMPPLYRAATFGDASLLKVAKKSFTNAKKSNCDKSCSNKKHSKHSHGNSVNKRTLKSESKSQTLMDKLVKKKPQSPPKTELSTQESMAQQLVISSQEKSETSVKKCTCSKSKCLKLYCECFASGQPCGPDCGCKECCNNESCSDLIQQSKEEILKRDPTAFDAKVTNLVGGKRLQHRKGCTCKKSGCLKGYCECFQLGVSCTEWCKCSGCANCEKGSHTQNGHNNQIQHIQAHSQSQQSASNSQQTLSVIKSSKKQKLQ